MKKLTLYLVLFICPNLLAQTIVSINYDTNGNRLAKKTQGSSPNPTVVASPSAVSLNGASTLTTTGCPGTVRWSTGQQGASISVTPSATTQYTAECQTTGCATNGVGQVTIEVYQCQPDNIGITSTLYSVRYGQAVTLTAYGCPGTVIWSNGQTGFTTAAQVYGSPEVFSAYCSKRNCPNSGVGNISLTGITGCGSGEVMVTIKDGDWNDPTVWQCNRPPAQNEEALIRHSVTVNGAVNGPKVAKAIVLSGGYIINQNGGSVDVKAY